MQITVVPQPLLLVVSAVVIVIFWLFEVFTYQNLCEREKVKEDFKHVSLHKKV